MSRMATQAGMPISMVLADAVLRIGLGAGRSVVQADLNSFHDAVSKAWLASYEIRSGSAQTPIEIADLVAVAAGSAINAAWRQA